MGGLALENTIPNLDRVQETFGATLFQRSFIGRVKRERTGGRNETRAYARSDSYRDATGCKLREFISCAACAIVAAGAFTSHIGIDAREKTIAFWQDRKEYIVKSANRLNELGR